MLHDLATVAAVALAVAACGGSVAPDPSTGSSGASSSGTSSGGSSGASSGSDGPVACTTIGCVDGLTLSLQPSGGWKPGSYVFTIDADGVPQVCMGKLPLPPCGSGAALTCKGKVAQIGESGCALPASAHGFADIQFRSSPSSVKLRVERDGLVLADAALVPEYRTSQPNGPSCGPICKQASATVTLVDP